MGSWISPFSPLSRIGLYSSVPWLFLIVWLKVWTLLILFKLMKTRSLKNACFGKMATVLAILVRRKNLTHGWNSHIIYLTRQSIKNHMGQFNFEKMRSQNLIVFSGTPCTSKIEYCTINCIFLMMDTVLSKIFNL